MCCFIWIRPINLPGHPQPSDGEESIEEEEEQGGYDAGTFSSNRVHDLRSTIRGTL